MIFGNHTRRIKRYLPIDRFGEGLSWVEPGENVVFIGHPYGYHDEGSAPFIEVQRENITTTTINALDCSEIEFMTIDD